MKKLLSVMLCVAMSVLVAFSLASCSTPSEGAISVYMPDGAPALAFAKLMNDNDKLGKNDVTYTVVGSSDIGGYVANSTADVALMPVNAAAKLCGTGEKYKLLSVNTHGNLYVLSKESPTSFSDIKGKKVGVVNLSAVPGLTFKAILNKNNIAFTQDASQLTQDNVYLENIEAGQVAALLNATNDAKLDYVVAPEPQVSKVTSAAPAIKTAFSLQELWGEDSYPQAVLVVKKELASDTDFCSKLLSALETSATWVVTNGDAAYDAVSSHVVDGYATTLKKEVLTESAIRGCNIKVVRASQMKNIITDYLDKIIQIAPGSTSQVSDAFFI